ncbi:ATP-binding protein [Paenibacillus sp. TAB 01]|uniref:ATP-binding protein n=1 Tax=Paenibacillus sp. TAB 01 TaxID=3368988 RepID=UPI0037530767
MLVSRVDLRNDLQELHRLNLFLTGLTEQMAIDEKMLFQLNLICDELITNTILYGYEPGEEGRHLIELQVSSSPDCLEVWVKDGGIPFNPLERGEPDLDLNVEERPVGGLGIHFVRQVMDELYYERSEGKNVIRLIKRRKQSK